MVEGKGGAQFEPLPPGAPAEYGGLLPRGADGTCAFFGVERPSNRCAIHRVLGPSEQPSACRHFPRVCLLDPRGVFVTLSHYCPTAAALLFRQDVTPAIVLGPSPLGPGETPEGLDARHALPPLLHPRSLTDLEGYAAWERHMIDVLVHRGATAEDALRQLGCDAEQLRGFSPHGGSSLTDRVAELNGAAAPASHGAAGQIDWIPLAAEVHRSVPNDLPAAVERTEIDARLAWERFIEGTWVEHDRPLRAYLAAKAFASWVAYQGQGVRTIVRSLQAALAVVRVEAARACAADQTMLDRPKMVQAFRQADLWLVHLADPLELARAWSRAEVEGPSWVC